MSLRAALLYTPASSYNSSTSKKGPTFRRFDLSSQRILSALWKVGIAYRPSSVVALRAFVTVARPQNATLGVNGRTGPTRLSL